MTPYVGTVITCYLYASTLLNSRTLGILLIHLLYSIEVAVEEEMLEVDTSGAIDEAIEETIVESNAIVEAIEQAIEEHRSDIEAIEEALEMT